VAALGGIGASPVTARAGDVAAHETLTVIYSAAGNEIKIDNIQNAPEANEEPETDDTCKCAEHGLFGIDVNVSG